MGRSHGSSDKLPDYAERVLNEEILPSIRILKSDVEEGVSLVGILEYFFKKKS